MIITKYGDLNNVGRSSRIKVSCSECLTEVILDREEYKLGAPLKWDYRAHDAWDQPQWFDKTYGREVEFECPMCGHWRTGKIFYGRMGKFYDSSFGKWVGRHRMGLIALAWIVGILAISGGIIILCAVLAA